MAKGRINLDRLRQGASNFEFSALLEGVSTLPESAESGDDDLGEQPSVSTPHQAALVLVPDKPDVKTKRGRPSKQQYIASRSRTSPRTLTQPKSTQELRKAVHALTGQLGPELDKLAQSLAAYSVQSAAKHLVAVNSVLEFLCSLDEDGAIARESEMRGAPPHGLSWPKPCWSVVEFGRSPLSGLLPAEADEEFVRELIYASWGLPSACESTSENAGD